MSETEIIRRQAREKCSFRPQTVITIREQRLQRWQNKLREFATAAGITHPTQDKLFCLSLYTCGLFRLSSVRFRSFLALGLGLRYHERSRVFWRKPIQWTEPSRISDPRKEFQCRLGCPCFTLLSSKSVSQSVKSGNGDKNERHKKGRRGWLADSRSCDWSYVMSDARVGSRENLVGSARTENKHTEHFGYSDTVAD